MQTESQHLTGLRFDHVAVASRRIRDLLPLYQRALGGWFAYGGDNVRVGYRAVTLRFTDGTKIELLEPLAGSAFLDGFFNRFPRGGIHHITMHTDDLDVALAAMELNGFPLTGLYRDEPSYQEVFVHPKNASGVLVQIVQTTRQMDSDGGLDNVLSGAMGNGVPSP